MNLITGVESIQPESGERRRGIASGGFIEQGRLRHTVLVGRRLHFDHLLDLFDPTGRLKQVAAQAPIVPKVVPLAIRCGG